MILSISRLFSSLKQSFQPIQISSKIMCRRFTHVGVEAVRKTSSIFPRPNSVDGVQQMNPNRTDIPFGLAVGSITIGVGGMAWWLSHTLVNKKDVEKQFERMDSRFARMEDKIDGIRDALLAGSRSNVT